MEKKNMHQILVHLLTCARDGGTLREQLALARTLFGKTQSTMAKELKQTQAYLSIFESGKRKNPTLRQIINYTEALELRPVLVPRVLLPFLHQVLAKFYKANEPAKKPTKARKGQKRS